MSISGEPRSRYIVWRCCCGSAIALTVMTFSPAVLDSGNARFLWLPASLVVGLVVALGFLLLTVAASRSYPEDTDSGDS
jgi:CBS-domain-containing membrane protein